MKKETKEKIINFILEKCEEKGTLPWDSGLVVSNVLPISYVTRKPYRGINRILLYYLNGFNEDGCSLEFVTFNQCAKLGGKVNKGEKSTPIIFFSMFNKTKGKTASAEINEDSDEIVPVWRTYNVFDISQTTLSPKRTLENNTINPNNERIDEFVEKFFEKTSLKLTNKPGTAYYMPGVHLVNIAGLQRYRSSEDYYSTIFHEMVHSTAKAMKRKEDGSSKEKYSKEEIVAEVGAMFLCSYFGIKKSSYEDNSAAYIKGWSEKLRQNPDWLIHGANAAERAVDYMLEVTGFKDKKSDSNVEDTNSTISENILDVNQEYSIGA